MERLSLSPNVFKIDDNNRILKVLIDSDGYQVRPSNDGSVYTLKVANDTGYVKDVPVDITIDTVTGISNLTVQTNTMLDLSADSYTCELWQIKDNKQRIYPNEGKGYFKVSDNITGVSGNITPSISLSDIEDQLDKINKKLENSGTGLSVSLDVSTRTLTVNNNQITIPTNVDISRYATIEELTNALAPYIKQTDADSKYVTADDIAKSLASYVTLQYLKSNYASLSTLDERLSSISADSWKKPTDYYVDTSGEYITNVFNNGCILTNNSNISDGFSTVWGWGYAPNAYATAWSSWPVATGILSMGHGTLTFETFKKGIDATYWDDNMTILNPIHSASDYDWSNAFDNDDSRKKWNSTKDWAIGRKRNVIRCFYCLGLFTKDQVESLGAIKNK